MIDVLTSISNKIWKAGEWPTTWTQSLIPSHHTPKERQLATVPELQNRTISHPGKVEDHPKQTPATSRRDHCKRASRFHSRKEHHRTNIQSQDPLREIPAASAESLPCLRRPLTGYGTKSYGQL